MKTLATPDGLPHIEVILPIFNEKANLPPLITQLDEAAKAIRSQTTVSYLFVNDGSHDGSEKILQKLNSEREDVRVINLIHNFGHGAAISAGIDYFQGDIALLMDADLQDAPAAMIDLFNEWKKGHKTVVAARGTREEKGRVLFKAFYYLLHKMVKGLPPINFGTHCLLDREVVERLRTIRERTRYFPGLVTYSSSDIKAVVIDRQARANGSSRVGLWGLINLALTAFLSFSSTPVKMVSVMGLVSSLVSIVAGISIVSIKLFTDRAIPGWASMMTALAFASGIQLLCLGIIGEYIARIYDEVKARPLYMVGDGASAEMPYKKVQSQSKENARSDNPPHWAA